NGRLYACQNDKKRIVSYDESAKETVVTEDVDSNDLAVNHKDEIYFTDPSHHKIWFINSKGQKSVVDQGIAEPNGIRLSPDQSLLIVADTKGEFVYSFHIQPDGSLADKQKYFYLHAPN